jgi:hypothetical protein
LAGRLSGGDRAARCPTRKLHARRVMRVGPRLVPSPAGSAESARGIPLFRSLAGGKGGSLAGRVFEGTSPPPCGVLSRKSETRRAKSPLNGQDSACPGERCSCYGEYKPVWMTCPEKPSTPSFSWPAPDKENPARGGQRGLSSAEGWEGTSGRGISPIRRAVFRSCRFDSSRPPPKQAACRLPRLSNPASHPPPTSRLPNAKMLAQVRPRANLGEVGRP